MLEAACTIASPTRPDLAPLPESDPDRSTSAHCLNAQPMRFFIPGIPHTVTSPEFCACAYTTKVLRLCAMLKAAGHTVIHLGHEDSRVDCTEHVTVVTNRDWQEAYGVYDWRSELFKFDTGDACYRAFYSNAIAEISRRQQPGDFLLCQWGAGHRPIADGCSDMIVVESGIGYPSGHFAFYKVFESYAMLHAYGGLPAVADSGGLGNYEVVIPNYFDLADFDYSAEKDDYFLFIGRLGPGKGLHVAVDACQRLGERLVIAGQGGPDSIGLQEWPAGVEFVGYADVEKRRGLLARAKGLFCLSQYVEPFGGVMIEAALSGTPVIATDWGAATENVLHGITGYRCRTFEHITWSIRNIDRIRPLACREWAAANFSMERVARMYEEFFRSVKNVQDGAGWYEPNEERRDLDWMTRRLPTTASGDGRALPTPSIAAANEET